MDFGAGNASGVDQVTSSNRSNNSSSRLSLHQIQHLEMYFNEHPYPTEKQQYEISEHLDLEPRQVMFWFQNRRTQMKAQFERVNYSTLHYENERLKSENIAMKHALQKLQFENAILNDGVTQLTGKPISEVNSGVPTGSPINFTVEGVSHMGMRGGPSLHWGGSSSSSTYATSQSETISSIEKSVMMETAGAAMKELHLVLKSNELLWTNNNGRYSINRHVYENVIMRRHHLRQNISGKLESSMDTCEVAIDAFVLVNIILDSTKRLDLFPTLVTNAETCHVVQTGTVGDKSGSLYLMREVEHSLSPMVAPREFYFLRNCQKIKPDAWVVADVSYGIPRGNDGNQMPFCRKLPSGCMIQAMRDGHSKVTWVELVEVDDIAATHQLYRDLVDTGLVFGAERWIATLKQMYERAVLSSEVPVDTHGATWSVEGKRCLLDLSLKMVKEFCTTLEMPINELDLNNMAKIDSSEIRVSTRKSTDPHTPEGIVLCGATSLWLPLCPKLVFAYFKDREKRSQWDFLSHGKPVTEIARAATGRCPGNTVSVFKPVAHDESHIAILQESLKDLLGYYLVFAPLELTTINRAVTGLYSSNTPVLPSGVVISRDGRSGFSSSDEDGGSLLTLAFQIMFSDLEYNMELVAHMKALLGSTVEQIKAALTPSI